jgi:hypothetical protein
MVTIGLGPRHGGSEKEDTIAEGKKGFAASLVLGVIAGHVNRGRAFEH